MFPSNLLLHRAICEFAIFFRHVDQSMLFKQSQLVALKTKQQKILQTNGGSRMLYFFYLYFRTEWQYGDEPPQPSGTVGALKPVLLDRIQMREMTKRSLDLRADCPAHTIQPQQCFVRDLGSHQPQLPNNQLFCWRNISQGLNPGDLASKLNNLINLSSYNITILQQVQLS